MTLLTSIFSISMLSWRSATKTLWVTLRQILTKHISLYYLILLCHGSLGVDQVCVLRVRGWTLSSCLCRSSVNPCNSTLVETLWSMHGIEIFLTIIWFEVDIIIALSEVSRFIILNIDYSLHYLTRLSWKTNIFTWFNVMTTNTL